MDPMTRMEEYRALRADLAEPPPALEYTVQRALARAKTRRRRALGSFVSAAAFCAAFVVLVNTSTTFAYACGRIPFIKELAQAVSFSPSLAAAVEHQYVQPVELEQTQNDITMRVEYLIVDQKQVNIFYTVTSPVYGWMDVTPGRLTTAEGESVGPYSIGGGGGFDGATRELRSLVVDFVEKDVPGSLLLTAKVQGAADALSPNEAPASSPFVDPDQPEEREYKAEFEFALHFDPYFTAQGRTVDLDVPVQLGPARLQVVRAEVYPTHFRLELTQPTDTDALVQSLDFHVTGSRGRRYDAISNGISATGGGEGYMASHRLESPWFGEAGDLTVTITGGKVRRAGWRVKIDLVNGTAENLPAGVYFAGCERHPEGWELRFEGEYAPGSDTVEQLFSNHYWDEQGNEYTINSWGSSNAGYAQNTPEDAPKRYGAVLYLWDVPGTTVWLEPRWTDRITLTDPVEFTVEAP